MGSLGREANLCVQLKMYHTKFLAKETNYCSTLNNSLLIMLSFAVIDMFMRQISLAKQTKLLCNVFMFYMHTRMSSG